MKTHPKVQTAEPQAGTSVPWLRPGSALFFRAYLIPSGTMKLANKISGRLSSSISEALQARST